MFRRRRRRRGGSRYKSSVTHIPNSVSQTLLASNSGLFYACTTANYTTTGTALTVDTFEQADRQQNTPIGADVNGIVYNLAVRDATVSAIIEIAFFKIERAHIVPSADDVLLPSNATIVALGLQAAFRQFQPGRLLKYVKLAVAPEQPRTLSIMVLYRKFKMAKVRTGDFYGVMTFNRSSGDVIIDYEARYKAQV